MRYPLLTPPLRPEWAVERIMDGIAREQEEVMEFPPPFSSCKDLMPFGSNFVLFQIWIPLFVRGVPLLRMVPTGVYDLLQDLLGVASGMRDFRGRH